MCQFSAEDIREDLGVLVMMGREALSWLYSIFVQDTEGAELSVFRVIPAGEREGMFGVEPAMVGCASGLGRPVDNLSVGES